MSDTVTYVEAIRLALRSALGDDDRVLVLGEDVGGGGGAFRATAGLQEEFGEQRVIDTPICEAAFTGAAVGMALDGMRPVVEFQFSDFLTSGMNAIVNTAAKMHFRHGLGVPLVIRAPAAGGFAGGPFHSQNPEAWFLRTPGLKVACPATAEDAGLLLGAAIADPNPVLFFEQKSLYTRVKGEFTYDTSAPLCGRGRAPARQRRHDRRPTARRCTSRSRPPACSQTRASTARSSTCACSARSISTRVAASVEKTGRCVIAHEDYPDYGVAAELAARLAGELFRALDAPVGRVGAHFWPIPFSPPLEQATLPTCERIAEAVRELARF